MADNGRKDNSSDLYLGIDIGGTKVQASLLTEEGQSIGRQRCRTPRGCDSQQVIDAIETAIDEVLEAADTRPKDLAAIGVAVPGVVDPDKGYVVLTPNMSLTGVKIGPLLQKRFGVPVAVGNDCNLGALGEKWIGSARHADSVVAILVGTGIGGGYVQKGKLWRGARESAGEIGHIVMQIGGPKCGCGNLGCLEALASRTAIERDIRKGIAEGRTSVLSALSKDDLGVIRSGMLRRALEMDDELVTEVLRRATEVLGHACLTVRHLIDPDVIVLGGGVVEACGEFMMPIVQEIVASDQLPGAREGGQVLISALGDDAVVAGAVALARRHIGRSPFKKDATPAPKYASLAWKDPGQVKVGGTVYDHDLLIGVSGKVKRRKDPVAVEFASRRYSIGPKELKRVCRGAPEILFIGTGSLDLGELNEAAQRYLAQRSIECCVASTPKAIDAYNKSQQRKAALLQVT